jgi:hypothetical protein
LSIGLHCCVENRAITRMKTFRTSLVRSAS